MRKLAFMLLMFICLSIFSVGAVEPIRVASWNLESGGSDITVIAEMIADSNGIDIWGLSEVDDDAEAEFLAAAAASGEGNMFEALRGNTGADDRLVVLYNSDRFLLLEAFELHDINPGGRVRSPLVCLLQDRESEAIFYFMVNHLYRSRDELRHLQSKQLNAWASELEYSVIAVGDYNYDWEVNGGDSDHDEGYDLLTSDGIFSWLRPDILYRTQCSATTAGGCRYNSVLDFIFVAGAAIRWAWQSEILVHPGDFPDNELTSDHRIILAEIVPES